MYRLFPILALFFSLLAAEPMEAQISRKVLFLGNSYTGVNNLPQLVKDVALSAGDTLTFDSRTPGGYTTEDHSLDPASIAKIASQNWDYMVLQGQSQEPIMRSSKFRRGAFRLRDSLYNHDSCAVTMLYMTWGRKNGDAVNCPNFPVMCSYLSMDSALRASYLDLTETLNAEVSPVSAVWRYLRQNHPGIELYQADGSHPSQAGTYAAACSFYAAIFKKDPGAISFDYNLNASDAAAIRNAAKVQVYDSLALWDYKKLPRSNFSYQIGSGVNEVIFSPISGGVRQHYYWDFGDGHTSTQSNPSHSYASNGSYHVNLTTSNCDWRGTHTSSTDTVIEFCSHTPTVNTSKAWLCVNDTLWTQTADSYQWYSGGALIPETRRFLPNYSQYQSRAFSVRSSVNGCAELSETFNANPVHSGYFFDAAWGGDPCEGDTALFIVKHMNPTLPDSSLILWYKDENLLPAATNEDTLLITTQGKYECKVVNPASQCPLDTTYSTPVIYDCGSLSVAKNSSELEPQLYPNPVSDILNIVMPRGTVSGEIRIYNAVGKLMKSTSLQGTDGSVNLADFPSGLYYIVLAEDSYSPVRFIKE